jgi:hypothetical protein
MTAARPLRLCRLLRTAVLLLLCADLWPAAATDGGGIGWGARGHGSGRRLRQAAPATGPADAPATVPQAADTASAAAAPSAVPADVPAPDAASAAALAAAGAPGAHLHDTAQSYWP